MGYTISNNANGDHWGKILVVFNGNNQPMNVDVPAGEWTAVGFDGKIELKGLMKSNGGAITIPATSAFIAYQ